MLCLVHMHDYVTYTLCATPRLGALGGQVGKAVLLDGLHEQ